jgi:hypothetical protein
MCFLYFEFVFSVLAFDVFFGLSLFLSVFVELVSAVGKDAQDKEE